jgi:RNA polymerase sigma factor (sigma-70 family)
MADRAETLLRHLRRLVPTPAEDPEPDADLLRRYVRDRDERAFAALVRRHGGLVLGVCRRVLGDAHRAEDAFQAAWLVFARKAATVRPADGLAGWLHGVARQTARNVLRGEARRRKHEGEARRVAATQERSDPLDKLTARELLLILDEEVCRLPECNRLPVLYCCWEGLSTEEAAQRLGWTPGSVKGRLERGRKLLHERLAKRGLTLSAALPSAEVSRGGAEVPAALVADTVRAALAGAAGVTWAAMWRFKAALVVLLILGAGAWSAGLLTRPPSGQERPQQMTEDAGRKTGRAPVRAGNDAYGDPLPPGAVARLGTVRFRYEGEATSLAFSPDSKILAGNTRSGVILWDAASGKELRRLPVIAPFNFPHALEFSPDGATLAVGAVEAMERGKGHLSLWEVATGKKLQTFSLPYSGPPSRYPRNVRFAPDGKSLAAAGEGAKAFILDLNSGRVRATFENDQGGFHSLAFSPDGKALALGTYRSGVQIWDAGTGELVRRVGGQNAFGWANCLAYARDGTLLAWGSWDGIVLADPRTGKELGRCEAKMESVQELAFTPDGKALVSGSQDGKLRVWDVATRKARLTLDGRMRLGRCMALTGDGKTAALGTVGQAIRLWDVATGAELFNRFAGHDCRIDALAFSPDGESLFTGGFTAPVRVWDTGSWRQSGLLPGTAHFLSVRPDGKRLAAAPAGKSSVVRLWEPDTGREGQAITVPDADSVGFVRFSSDGKTLITADWKSRQEKPQRFRGHITRLRRWEASTCLPSGELTLPDDVSTSLGVEVTPDGNTAFVASLRGWLYVADLEAGLVRYRMGEEGRQFRVFAVSADGGLLLSAIAAKEVRVWEVASGQPVLTFRGHRRTPFALALSPDGRVAASADDGYPGNSATSKEGASTLRLWDVATGEEVAKFEGYGADVTALGFSPDGTRLAAGLGNGSALVFDVARWTRALRPAANRLSAAELQALWNDLAGDAARAYRAGWTLSAAPGLAVPFLRERLRPVPATDPEDFRRWIGDLDSKAITVRSRAQAAISRLGRQAEPAIAEALKGKPSLEVRRRLEEIRKTVEGVPGPETLRTLRAIRVLERAGSPAARAVLKEVASGAPAAQETRAARAALDRLAKRPAVP